MAITKRSIFILFMRRSMSVAELSEKYNLSIEYVEDIIRYKGKS